MNALLVSTIILKLVSGAPTGTQTRNDYIGRKTIVKRAANCDLKASPLGNTYFRKATPWGQELDMPCPSGHLFHLETCNCEQKRCAALDTDPSAYMEYVDTVGDWVTGQCPQDMVYRADYCMCTLKNDYVTSAPKTSLATVLPGNCPYRQKGHNSYEEYFPSINDWVTNYCAYGSVYSALYCKCIMQASTQGQMTDATTKPATKTPIIQPPSSCPYVKLGPSSYKEYRDDLGDWLTSYCPAGEIFSSTWCACLVEGQTPDYSGFPTTPPLIQNCNFQKSGPTSYNEYVPEIGAWVTNNCASGKVYSHPHCTCVDKDLIQPDPETTTVASTTLLENPDCDLRPVGKSSYQKYETYIEDWVTVNCHAGMVFSVLLCHCIKEGVVVTSLPVTTTEWVLATNPNCPYVPVSQRSYKEYIADVGIWVTNDCPSDMVFNVAMCSCHPDGSADIIVVPITTVPPLNIPTVPNCPHKKSGDGYLEYVTEINIWVYNVCPIYYEFVKEYCTCLSQDDIRKIPKTSSTNAPSTTAKISTTTVLLTSTIEKHTSSLGTSLPTTLFSTTAQPTKNPSSQLYTTAPSTKPTTTIKSVSSTSTTSTPPATSQSTSVIPKTSLPTSTTVTTTTKVSTQPTSQSTTLKTSTQPPTTQQVTFKTSLPTTSLLSSKATPMTTTIWSLSSTTTDTPKTTELPSTTTSTTSSTLSSTTHTNKLNGKSTPNVVSSTAKPCEKSASPLGNKYYDTYTPGWGEMTFMCPSKRIFYLPMCDCVSTADIPSTRPSTQSTPMISTSSQQTTTKTTTTITTSTTPTTTTTTPTTTKATTQKPTSAETKTTAQSTTPRQTVCPLIPSSKGIEYFKIDLGTWGAIEMICPYHQIFVPEKCRCLPH